MILGLYPYFYAFIYSYLVLNLYNEIIQGMMYILGMVKHWKKKAEEGELEIEEWGEGGME